MRSDDNPLRPVGAREAPDLHTGLTHYDESWVRADGCFEKTLPADPGTSHAAHWPTHSYRPAPVIPVILDRNDYLHALCGHTIKVLLPIELDASDQDACPHCAAHAANGTSEPPRRPGLDHVYADPDVDDPDD